jgi:hypothetical protein
LLPLMVTVPCRGTPPLIKKLSMFVEPLNGCIVEPVDD